MSGRSGRLGGERGVSSVPQTTVAGEFYRRAQKPAPRFDEISHIDRYANETAAPTQKRDTLHTILHVIGIILALVILLLVSTRAHAQGSVNQNTYDSSGQLKIVCSGCSAASSVTVNDPSVTTQKAGVSAAGNLAVECKVGCAGGATTPADTFTNPTTAGLSFDFLALWNGSTWDRWKGDATNGAFVNVKTSVLPTGASTEATLAAIKTDVDKIPASPSTDRTTAAAPFATELSDGASFYTGAKTGQLPTALDGSGFLKTHEQGTAAVSCATGATCPVNATLAAETTKIIGEVEPVATATTTDTLLTSYTASAASTNATSVKGSAGNVYAFILTNTTTTVYYLRMYNLATAPTCSSATGFIESYPVQPAGAAGGVGGMVIPLPIPEGFSTGIAFCLTGGSSSTDNTNAATGVQVNIKYK